MRLRVCFVFENKRDLLPIYPGLEVHIALQVLTSGDTYFAYFTRPIVENYRLVVGIHHRNTRVFIRCPARKERANECQPTFFEMTSGLGGTSNEPADRSVLREFACSVTEDVRGTHEALLLVDVFLLDLSLIYESFIHTVIIQYIPNPHQQNSILLPNPSPYERHLNPSLKEKPPNPTKLISLPDILPYGNH